MPSGACKFRDALGKPGTGLHKWRLGGKTGTTDGLAIVDILMTLALAVLLNALVLKCKAYMIPVLFALLWIVGLLLHHAFCVSTPLTNAVFGRRN